MQTRLRAKMEFFQTAPDLLNPGEYGSKDKRNGWLAATIPELNNQIIYLASASYARRLADLHRIQPSSVVNLIAPSPLAKHGIPEEYVDGKKGLSLFNERLGHIDASHSSIIIHCKHGLNRTPVAAVIYLVNQGIAAERAVALISSVYAKYREPGFVLNKRGHYTEVLNEIGIHYAQSRVYRGR